MTNGTPVIYDADIIKALHFESDISDSLSVSIALLCLYLTVSQIWFLINKHRQMRYHVAGNCASRSRSTEINDRKATIITIMCIVAAFTAFLKVGLNFRYLLGRHSDSGCQFALKTNESTYWVSTTCVYLTLWMRQRVFYHDPRLKHLSTKFIRGLSWSSAIIFVLAAYGSLALFLFGVEYVGTPYGCIPVEGTIANVRWIVLIVQISFQVIFLGLFIYPLLKHQQDMSRANIEQGNPVINLVKRVTIMAVICVVAYLISAIAAYFLQYDTRRLLLSNFNIIINITTSILTFKDWKMRVMPWRMKQENKEMTTMPASATHSTFI